MTKLKLVHPDCDYQKISNDFEYLDNLSVFRKNQNYYTSLHDLSESEIIKISNEFATIELYEKSFPAKCNLYAHSKKLIDYINRPEHKKKYYKITNLDLKNSNKGPTLWIFGCSHSNGFGLKDNEKSYGQLLSEKLNLPVKVIAQNGSSLHWSLRHLLNAPIRSIDKVVWQITNPARISYCTNIDIEEIILSGSNDRYLINVFNDHYLNFLHLNFLNTGIQFLRLVDCKFVLIAPDCSDFERLEEYSKIIEYYSIKNIVDFTEDKNHFGPKTQINIADQLYSQFI